MKLSFLALSLVPLLLPTVLAAQSSPSIDVTAPTSNAPTLSNWAERTGNQLSQRLQYPIIMGGPQEGIVQVKFTCSDSGAPANVMVLNSSGSSQLDNAAMRAIRHIPSLHPLPAGIGAGQRYVATVLFAASQASYVRQIRDLRRVEQDQNSRFAQRLGKQGVAIALLDPADTSEAVN